MKDYEVRVIHERADLYIKITKLEIFMRSAAFTTLGHSEVVRFNYQLESMKKYMDALDQRISEFK